MQTSSPLAATTLLSFAAMLLSACGGGGGSPSTPPPVIASPPPYTLTPATASASPVAGYPASILMTAKQTVTFTGVAYIQIAADAAIFQSPITVTPNGDGTAGVAAQTLASLAVGHYTGKLTVSVCEDANCAKHLSGSPFKVPYDIDVLSPDGSVTRVNLSKLSALAGAGDWGTFQGNAAHTGHVPVTLDAKAFNLRWVWNAPAYAGVQWSPTTLATGKDMFYVGSGRRWVDQTQHELFAYREDDGSKVWSHSFQDLGYPSTNPPAYANGKVYAAAGSQESTSMFAFDASTGAQVFKTPMTSQWENYLAPVVWDGTVYTNAGRYGGLYALDATSGTQTFFADLPQFDQWSPALDSTQAYAYVNGTLHVLDRLTGTTRFRIADPHYDWSGYSVGSAPVLGGADIAYSVGLSANPNSIVSYDTRNGSVRWSTRGFYAGNPAYADGLLFIGNSSPLQLEARNENDGSLAWSWAVPAGSTKFIGSVLSTRNLVFVSTDTTTYAIDRSTHASVWSQPVSGQLAISANGVLYIVQEHKITAVNLR